MSVAKEAGVSRRLSAILAADVVGFSALVGADEDGTLTALKRLRSEFIGPLVDRHGGRIVNISGDGFLVEFASAVAAVRAALDWQRGLGSGTDGSASQLQFRIGVNLGDILADGDDIHGDGVNIAARLEGRARPGGLCIADAVHQSVAGRVDASFTDLGVLTLKNIRNGVRAWQWAEATASSSFAVATGAPEPLSVAVLPFDDLGAAPDEGHVCDGMTEDLITELAHVPGLTVIARHSSFAYKGRSVDIRRIGAELGVRHLVEGSVRRSGARLRITAQLIDACTGGHLWAARYDRRPSDIFDLQDEVVREIAAALSDALSLPPLETPSRVRPPRLDAYELVVRGRQSLLSARTHGQARGLLEQALALAPDLSDAHAWLAVYYYTDAFLYHREPEREAMMAGFAAADAAIECGPENALAHMALGMVSLYAGRRAVALQSLHRALDLNPNEADAHCLIQDAYTFDGDPERGVASVRRAMRLNPHFPDWYRWHLGFALYCTRDYEGAVAELAKLQEIAEPLRVKAAAEAQLGRMDAASETAGRFLAANPGFSSAAWGRTQPFRNRADLEHVLEGYRLAGLPD